MMPVRRHSIRVLLQLDINQPELAAISFACSRPCPWLILIIQGRRSLGGLPLAPWEAR